MADPSAPTGTADPSVPTDTADPARDGVGPHAVAGPLLGRVASFDSGRGIGTVAAETGAEYGFHATAIADGSRRIEVGTRVAFTVAPGRRGRYEARSVLPLVPRGAGPAGA